MSVSVGLDLSILQRAAGRDVGATRDRTGATVSDARLLVDVGTSAEGGRDEMTHAAGYLAFDLDGCLLDSDRAHFDAVNRALYYYDERITEAEHLSTFKGLPTRKKLTMLVEMGRIPSSAQDHISTLKQSFTAEAIRKETTVNHAAQALLTALREAGWRMCCCSNSIRETTRTALEQLGLMEYMEFYLSNEDVDHPKPAPDIYYHASQRFGIAPRQLVVVEDAEVGRKAAREAGCRLVAIDGPQDITDITQGESYILHRILAANREGRVWQPFAEQSVAA